MIGVRGPLHRGLCQLLTGVGRGGVGWVRVAGLVVAGAGVGEQGGDGGGCGVGDGDPDRGLVLLLAVQAFDVLCPMPGFIPDPRKPG
jgi:hypothetical protein